METKRATLLLMLLPLAAAMLLSSCTSTGYYPGGGRHTTYGTLPRNYSGPSYFYNNRYYAGGRYETGRYSYGGRTYVNRYYHNGQYLYGGAYRQVPIRTVYGPMPVQVRGGGYMTYNTLPPNYAGTAYYYDNRYYAGGRYETGRYTNQGRAYTNRYYHNGQYLYGGAHQQHAVRNANPYNQGWNPNNRKKRGNNARSGY